MRHTKGIYVAEFLQTLLESAEPLNNQRTHAKDLLTGTKEGCTESFEIY